MERRRLGIGVVGAGRIGTLRAGLAAAHPAVDFLAVSDLDPSRAAVLAERVGASFHSGENLEVIAHPRVDAVIVSASEPEHARPVLEALERGKPVLVEKPIAMCLEDADRMVAAAFAAGVPLHVGYSQRFKRRYLVGKEQILQGRLGRILGGAGRVYNTRATAFQILRRAPDATLVLDVLTYWVDMVCWFLEGNAPVEVVARGQGVVFREAGFAADDVTWAILTFADGAAVSLGVCYALPERYPTMGQSIRLEILGTEGVLLFDDDHKDKILCAERGIPHGYVPGHGVNLAFLGSNAPGDWALGDFWGPLASETRAWLDFLATGHPCVLATATEARRALAVTLAIDESARRGAAVGLPPLTGG